MSEVFAVVAVVVVASGRTTASSRNCSRSRGSSRFGPCNVSFIFLAFYHP